MSVRCHDDDDVPCSAGAGTFGVNVRHWGITKTICSSRSMFSSTAIVNQPFSYILALYKTTAFDGETMDNNIMTRRNGAVKYSLETS
jgi:hypothetical protein